MPPPSLYSTLLPLLYLPLLHSFLLLFLTPFHSTFFSTNFYTLFHTSIPSSTPLPLLFHFTPLYFSSVSSLPFSLLNTSVLSSTLSPSLYSTLLHLLFVSPLYSFLLLFIPFHSSFFSTPLGTRHLHLPSTASSFPLLNLALFSLIHGPSVPHPP